jgi:mannose-6-phosphate isomerase-like protein (cupin superfamily)
MRTILIVGAIVAAFLMGQVLATPSAKHLIDATPAESVLVNLAEWFAQHPVKEGEKNRSDVVFTSPRSAVSINSATDTKGIGRHIHTTVDEIIYVYKGEGEIYINGTWTRVKAGDLHVCPRGVAHATRAVAGKEYLSFNIFTPPQPKGGDRVMIDQ